MRMRSSDSERSGRRRRLRSGALVALVLALGAAAGAQVTVPFPNFTLGTTADPSQVNANFAALSNQAFNRTGGVMTGTLTSLNITPSVDATYALGDGTHRYTNAFFSGTVTAGTGTFTTVSGAGSGVTALNGSNISSGTVATARGGTGLDGSAAANGRLLIGNGAGYTLANLTAGAGVSVTNGAGTITLAVISNILDRQVTTQTVANTIAETTVYSYAVPGGTLGTNKTLHLSLIGDHLINNGANDSLIVKVKYGATTIFNAATAPFSINFGANRGSLSLDLELTALNATGAQVAKGFLQFGDSSQNNAGGVAGSLLSTNSYTMYGVHNTVAEDSTASKNLVVTYQMGTANAAIDMRAHTVYTELK